MELEKDLVLVYQHREVPPLTILVDYVSFELHFGSGDNTHVSLLGGHDECNEKAEKVEGLGYRLVGYLEWDPDTGEDGLRTILHSDTYNDADDATLQRVKTEYQKVREERANG